MTTAKRIESLVSDIATATGKAATRKEAIERNMEYYLTTENAAVYGGYRLISVKVETGAHASPLPGTSSVDPRMKPLVFETFLRGILIGLNFTR